jgi:hypothetical protein
MAEFTDEGDLDWTLEYCFKNGSVPNSITEDSNLDKWIDVGEQLLHQLRRSDFILSGDGDRTYSITAALDSFPIYPLFAYYCGLVTAVMAVRKKLISIMPPLSAIGSYPSPAVSCVERLKQKEAEATTLIAHFPAFDAMGFASPTAPQDIRSNLNISRYSYMSVDGEREEAFFAAQWKGWDLLNKLLSSSVATALTEEGSTLQKSIRDMSYRGFTEAIDLRDDLEELLSFFPRTEGVRCRQEAYWLERKFSLIYGDLPDEIKSVVEQGNHLFFSDGGSGIAASFFDRTTVNGDKDATLAHYEDGDEGISGI